jgi:hypothetical protein
MTKTMRKLQTNSSKSTKISNFSAMTSANFQFAKWRNLLTPKILKYQAKLKFVDKGGKNLCNEEEIIDLCHNIKEVLSIECQKERSCNHYSSSSKQLSPKDRESVTLLHVKSTTGPTNGRTAQKIGITNIVQLPMTVQPLPVHLPLGTEATGAKCTTRRTKTSTRMTLQ